ncbi:MAG: phosphatidylinositol mannoside acyltransferase [Acidimicrobiales bacterium]|nr:phosphatidylinositol mannoside acyltransferase [Acidimicrobiales bacterium]
MPPSPSYLGYRTASAIARCLPEAAIAPTSRIAGLVAPHLMKDRAAMAARHQQRARPDLDGAELNAAVRAVFSSYVHYWLESFRLPGTTAAKLDSGFSHEGFDHVLRGLDAGRGVILALPHLGGWEWAGFWLTAVRDIPMSVVVEQVEPPELAEWFTSWRSRFGMEVIPLDASAGTKASAALAANHVLSLICDRDISDNGVPVVLLGEETTMPAGPATLAIRSGAPLIPAAVYLDEHGYHHGVAREPIDTTRRGKLRADVARITQDLADAIGELILAAPEQWHLLQPNWPSDRSGAEDR